MSVSSAPGAQPSTEVPAGPYPFVVQSDEGRQVPVVQAYAFGKYLGYLKVTFDEAGNVVTSVGNPILLDGSVPQGEQTVCTRISSSWFLSMNPSQVQMCLFQILRFSPTCRSGGNICPTTRLRWWEELWCSWKETPCVASRSATWET